MPRLVVDVYGLEFLFTLLNYILRGYSKFDRLVNSYKFNDQIVCMNSGMAKTVEKYRKHSYATMDPNQSAKDLQVHT